MRARCVFCVCRRPAEPCTALRTALLRQLHRSRPADSTNTTPNSASSPQAALVPATPPKR